MSIIGFADTEAILKKVECFCLQNECVCKKNTCTCRCNNPLSQCICRHSFSENMQEHCSYAFSIEMFHSNGDEVEFLTANMKLYIGENTFLVFILRFIRISELLLIERNKYPELKGGPNKKFFTATPVYNKKNKI